MFLVRYNQEHANYSRRLEYNLIFSLRDVDRDFNLNRPEACPALDAKAPLEDTVRSRA